MKLKTLLRVPLICLIGGIAAYYAVVYLLGRFAVVTLPDGSISISQARQAILYAAIFLAVLLIGGRFVRGMARREALLSAAIVTAYGLLLLFAQWALGLTTGTAAVVMYRLHIPFEWCNLVSVLLYQLVGGEAGIWLGAAIDAFPPLLFALFAGRAPEAAP